MEEIGVVVGSTETGKFVIALPRNTEMTENEYVVVKVRERKIEREVVGRIYLMGALSSILTQETSYEALKKLVDNDVDTPKIYAMVESLGYLDGSTVKFPRNPPIPGESVYRAPSELLDRFYYVGDMPIHIGSLLTREDVRINLNPRGFLRHIAIIGQTGSGKSYTSGVLIEELYESGASIVIVDPHADYVRMNRDRDGNVIIERFSVFRNPMSVGRFEDVDAKDLKISISDLEPDEFCDVLDIPGNASRIRGVITAALEELGYDDGKPISFDKLFEKLKEWMKEKGKVGSGYKPEDAQNALRYLRRAQRRGLANIFSSESTPIEEMVKEMHISVIDLSGLRNEVQDILVSIFIRKIHERNVGTSSDPVFLVIEEAHNFVPYGKGTKSKEIIKKIAAEGRKFGLMLVLITQRPHKIDPDALSQANSYILLRLNNPTDINAVRVAAENLGEDLSQLLPRLNPGEAVVVGPVINLPAIVKIKERRTQEGGGDIDIVRRLKEAKSRFAGE